MMEKQQNTETQQSVLTDYTIPEEMFIGFIKTEIVGIRHYKNFVRPQEQVTFVREPGNTHDVNALKVYNIRSKHVGYVPRKTAFWMSQLIDQGAIRVEGTVNVSGYEADQEFSKYHYPLTVFIHLLRKGHDLLKEKEQPYDEKNALHAIVLRAFLDANLHYKPHVVDFTGACIETIMKTIPYSQALPETHLLAELFPSISSMKKYFEQMNDTGK